MYHTNRRVIKLPQWSHKTWPDEPNSTNGQSRGSSSIRKIMITISPCRSFQTTKREGRNVISVTFTLAWLPVPHVLVWVFHKWDFHAQQCIEFTQNGAKIHPVSDIFTCFYKLKPLDDKKKKRQMGLNRLVWVDRKSKITTNKICGEKKP